MNMEFKYKKNWEFYLQTLPNVYVKAKVLDIDLVKYETRPSKVFYYLEIEGRDNDWFSESFIDACAIKELKNE